MSGLRYTLLYVPAGAPIPSLDAEGHGQGTGEAMLTVMRVLAADGKGTGAGDALLTVPRLLAADGRGQGTSHADLDVVRVVRLVAAGYGAGAAQAGLTVARLLAADGAGAGAAATDLLVARLLTANGTGRASGFGELMTPWAAVGIGRGGGEATLASVLMASGAGRADALAALTVIRALAADGRGQGRAHDGYTGPGTGLVTGTLTEDQFLASLREGDTFRVVVPSAVPWGRTALARVLGREIDQAGRPVLTLQLEGWPEPQRVLVQDTASVPRYQPATALDPARRIVETERAVAQVAARTTE